SLRMVACRYVEEAVEDEAADMRPALNAEAAGLLEALRRDCDSAPVNWAARNLMAQWAIEAGAPLDSAVLKGWAKELAHALVENPRTWIRCGELAQVTTRAGALLDGAARGLPYFVPYNEVPDDIAQEGETAPSVLLERMRDALAKLD